MYKQNPACYGDLFAIPTDILSIPLRELSKESLFIILWIYKHPSDHISLDALHNALSLSMDEIMSALDFWVKKGVLLFTDDAGHVKFVPHAKTEKAEPVTKATAKKQGVSSPALPNIALVKPTMEQIAARMQEDKTVEALFTEAQSILGRTFGLDMQGTLLTFLDTYGLPREVILTLLQHLTEVGRNSNANIIRVGKLDRILAGETCAQVSDAGSPAISDPGEDLVRLCAEHGIPVCAIPGPCAVITALSISGLPTGRFCFEGFLSTSKKSRREHLDSLKQETRTMIFYEAPHKLVNTLEDLAEAFGADRKISLCRELTKLHEEVVRTTLGEAVERYTQNAPKGEFVLVVEGAAPVEAPAASEDDAASRVRALMEGGMSRKDAVRQTAKELNLPKNVVYDASLAETEAQE